MEPKSSGISGAENKGLVRWLLGSFILFPLATEIPLPIRGRILDTNIPTDNDWRDGVHDLINGGGGMTG